MESFVDNPSTQVPEDFLINGVVTIPKVQTRASLRIQSNADMTIEKTLVAKCVYVGESAKLTVKGSLESGIYLHQGASVLIEGNAEVNALYVINESKLSIQGNLVLETTHNIQISNHSCLLVKGSMTASVKSLSLHESSLIVHDDLQIDGKVYLLKKSILETKGNATMKLGLNIQDGCTINIGKNLNVSRKALTIGSNSEIVIGDTLHSLNTIHIKKSVKIQAMSFIAEFDLTIESGSSLLIKNHFTGLDRVTIESFCVIKSRTIGIHSNSCVFGSSCIIEASEFSTSGTNLSDGVVIGSNSLMYIKDRIKNSKGLVLASNVRLKTKKLSSYYITLAEGTKLDTDTIEVESGLHLSENCEIVAYNHVKAYKLTMKSDSCIDIHGNLLIETNILVDNANRINVRGYLACKTMELNGLVTLMVCGNVRSNIININDARVYFHQCVLANSVLVDSNSILLIDKCLFAKELNNHPENIGFGLAKLGDLGQEINELKKEMTTLLEESVSKKSRLETPDTVSRLVIGCDAYLVNELHTKNRSVTIIGNLYINKKSKLDKTQVIVKKDIIPCSAEDTRNKINTIVKCQKGLTKNNEC